MINLKAEIGRLQKKIKMLKNENNALELQVNSLQAEERVRDRRRSRKGEIWDNSMDKGYEQLKEELELAKEKLAEYELGGYTAGPENKKALHEFAMRTRELENENVHLRNQNTQLRANAAIGGIGDPELQRENQELKRKVVFLEELIETKEAIIESLGNNQGDDINMNLEALANLKRANERLSKKVADLQQNLNSSIYTNTINPSGDYGSRLGMSGDYGNRLGMSGHNQSNLGGSFGINPI